MTNDVKYRFYREEDGAPCIESDLVSAELDLLDLVSCDVRTAQDLREYIVRVKNKKVCWVNAAKVDYRGDTVVITPAFDWDARGELPLQEFVKILEEFLSYIESLPK